MNAESEMNQGDGLGAEPSPGTITANEMADECGYKELPEPGEDDGGVDALIAYKDACEERMIAMIDGPGQALQQIKEVAAYPVGATLTDDALTWARAKLERIANIAEAGEPDEDYRPAMWAEPDSNMEPEGQAGDRYVYTAEIAVFAHSRDEAARIIGDVAADIEGAEDFGTIAPAQFELVGDDAPKIGR